MATSRNPMDNMKSTWRTWDRDQWKLPHKIFEHVNVYHIELNRDVPIHPKEDKIPYVSDWSLNRWVLVHSGVPLLAHQAFTYFTGYNFHPIIAFLYYYQASRLFTTRELRILRELGHTYGFLDGDKHERDGVPDVGVSKALISVLLAGLVRPLMTVWLTYDANKPPASLSWAWLFVEISLYGIILDFWFYWYHRVMHDVNGLWKFHRTHHLTKHPNPLLTIYADSEQEFFDIAGIPLMTWFTMKLMGMPMGFYEWHVCQMYVIFAELAGHSGLRLHASPPNPVTWLMRMFDAELVIEDHDLHHRRGWKKSHNYGKQTRVWDRVFGTCSPRIESVKANIDYDNPVCMPIL
ncbi:Fatty acid hydroxylase [Penicillium expansum]|nr:Fatty acid hydroxylase [Penicillium expansum]